MLKIQSNNLRWVFVFLRLQIKSPCYCHHLISFQNQISRQRFLSRNYLESAAFSYYPVVIENLHLTT